MRKLLPSFVFPFVFLGVVQAQSIGPQVINSTGGSYKIPSSNFVLDWNVGEMTLVHTSVGTDWSGIYFITNGFLQPTKYGHVKDDKHGDDFYTRNNNPVAKPKVPVELTAFPNPAVNYVEVNVLVPEAGNVRFSLYNQVGQLVYSGEKAGAGLKKTERIPMSKLTPGTYLLFVECVSADGTSVRTGSFKIVKTN